MPHRPATMVRLANRWRDAVALLLILLLAFGLRLYRIEAQSLWNDEGTSVALAAPASGDERQGSTVRDLTAITRAAANDIHPPLYYYLLHFWIALFGKSELAVRSLSALLGTLAVLLTFALGSFLAGHRIALLGACFAALSPFQIYYSQETRMYILTAFLGAASMYAFLRLLSSWQGNHTAPAARDGTAAMYALATISLLYTHYFAATVIVVQNLAFLWWLAATRKAKTARSALLHWAALQVVIGAAYAPWLLLVRQQLGVWPAISEPLPLTALVLDLLRVFSLGLSVEAQISPTLVGFAALLLLGVLAPLFSRTRPTTSEASTPSLQGETAPPVGPYDARRRSGAVATGRDGLPGAGVASMSYVVAFLYLFAPVAILYALSLRRPMYNPKFLLLCSVPFCLFLAQGAVALGETMAILFETVAVGALNRGPGVRRSWLGPWLRRVFLLAATVFVAVASLSSLQAYYFNPRYARDDYRAIAQYIQAIGAVGDAVLINAPGQTDTFTYYYQGELPLYPLPRQRPLDEEQTLADLQQMVQGRKRIFAVLWATDESDPERFVEGWLDDHAYKAMDSWYGNVRLVIYAVPEQPVEDRIEHPLVVELGEQVRLLGYNLPRAEVRPGDILQLTLFWQAIAPMTERYKVFTHVLDAYGHLVGQRDAEPGGGAKITTIWKEEEQIVDNYGLPILPGTPPGDYAVEIGLYGLSDGRRLPALKDGQAVGDHIVLQSVRVLPALAPPPLSVLGMRGRLDARFQDVMLLGYDLTKLGFEHEPDAPIYPGDVLHLTLFWQRVSEPSEDMVVQLRVEDATGQVWLERLAPPTEGLYPATLWRMNEIIRDQHNLFLPADLPTAKPYRISLSVQRPLSGAPIGTAITVASLTIPSR